jgi:hypothetical protein
VDLQGQQDEPLANLELVARSATDEVLVAAAKLGDRLAFVELWRATRIQHSGRSIGSRGTMKTQKT